ncbi:MAG: AAC(3) family N-acetyltransferase [Sandaracinus sp.]
MLDRVIAAGEVAGRTVVAGVPRLRPFFGRWARRERPSAAPVSLAQLEAAIREAGVEPGRDLLVHSSWAGMHGLRATPRQVVGMLRDVVGPSATLLMPSHPVEKARDGALVYDVAATPSRMGLLPESMRRLPGVRRCPCPIAPVAALGPRAEEYTRDHRLESERTPWGRGSAYAELCENGGQVLVLGIDFVRTLTLMHTAFDLLLERNPIADYYEDVDYWVTWQGREERWTLRQQRRDLDGHLATFAFRRMALRSGTVREIVRHDIRIAVADAKAFLEWHLPIAERTGMPYWGFRHSSKSRR